MFTAKVLRHILIPTAAVITEKTKPSSNDCCCRPSELPIYSYEPQPIQTPDHRTEPSTVEIQFQEAVGTVRRKISDVMGTIKNIEATGEDYLSEGITTVLCYVEVLQEDDNTTPKYGAIAIGGLTGLILGLRGRFFKRTMYTSIGALAMAALCYPKEAKEYSQLVYKEGTRYFTIGYNFLCGVKKGDASLQLPTLPTLSGGLSDAWDSAKRIVTPKSSLSVTVTDTASEPEVSEKLSEKKK